MCWIYEIEYKGCFDHFDGTVCYDKELFTDTSVTAMLEKNYGVDIVDRGEFRRRIIQCLTDMHEDGVIRPNEECKMPTEVEIDEWFDDYKEYKRFPQLKSINWMRKQNDLKHFDVMKFVDELHELISDEHLDEIEASENPLIRVSVEILDEDEDKR